MRTYNIKAKVDKTQGNSKSRMGGKAVSVNHLLRECSTLAQKMYKRKNGWFGTKIHCEIWRIYGIEAKEKWYERKPDVVMENNKCKILWDFTVQTDHEIYGRRPDIIVVQKDKNLCQIIDFADPNNGRLDNKELGQIEHYQDLARELRKMEHESQGYTISDRCNTHKVKKMVKGNNY